MIPQNLEKLFTENSYDFYRIQEVGVSNKELAYEHRLFEQFFEQGVEFTSTFEEIYREDLYCKNNINQIWIFKEDRPIGICMGIEHTTDVATFAQMSGFKTNVGGYIQLYIRDEHRGQGLASKCIPLLEQMFNVNKDYPCAFIMQDNAYPFGKYLEKGCAISSKRMLGDFFANRKQLDGFYTTILKDKVKLDTYLNEYPGFKEQYKQYLEKENKEHIKVLDNQFKM